MDYNIEFTIRRDNKRLTHMALIQQHAWRVLLTHLESEKQVPSNIELKSLYEYYHDATTRTYRAIFNVQSFKLTVGESHD